MKKKLLILAASCLIAVLLAELALRLFYGPYITQVYTLDPVTLHRALPGTEKRFAHHPVNGGHVVAMRVNADGYRGEPLRPQGAALRVAVFGDSFVMGEYSELEHTFCEQLERQLATALGDDVECVNAGVVAYGPDQSLRRMQADLPKLAPQLALLVIFADNDFGDPIRNKLYRLGPDGELIDNEFTIAPRLRQTFTPGWLSSWALYRTAQRTMRAWRADSGHRVMQSSTPEQVRTTALQEVEKWIAGSDAEYRDYVERGNNEVRSLFEDHFDADVALAPTSESSRYKIAMLGAIFGRIASVADAAKVPLLVVVVPSPYEMCGPDHGGAIDREKYPHYDPTAMTRVVVDQAAAHGLRSVNLFDAFDARGADELYFLAPDNHWNDAGQALAAEVVAEFVVAQKLLEARAH